MKKNLFPKDIHNMSLAELELLTYEIRAFLLDTISKTGGHLASNLGIVELTVALHKVFDSPNDKLIWDVGHQSYVHKLLTGRSPEFHTLRQFGGISGFPKVNESVYDTFDMGHSSTSISLATGFAIARDLKNENHQVVAVIGDGAFTGGLVYEALNNLGDSKSKAIIVLNDNEMSISKNTGGISRHLSRLRMSRTYLDFKKQIKSKLVHSPKLYSKVEHLKDSIKYAIANGHGAFFEELGFNYFGPVDGHNVEDLVGILSLAKDMDTPVVIHAITKKGKGYKNAENNPGKFHGIEPFDVTTGTPHPKEPFISYSQVFGETITKLARNDESVVAISAAMLDSTGLGKFKEEFPKRTFDVGIAEAHAVTFAAGLASQGLKPFVAIYSSFLQRAYDQIMSDVCLSNLPVVFAVDRAGNVGSDGETHHGIYDFSYLAHVPNLTVLAPKDEAELEKMLEYAYSLNSPCVVRYPKGRVLDFSQSDLAVGDVTKTVYTEGDNLKIETGKSELISTGSDVEIWAIGSMVSIAVQAAEIVRQKGYSVGVINARFLKPLDENALLDSINRTKVIVTIEDNVITGGFGSCVMDFVQSINDKTIGNFDSNFSATPKSSDVKILKLGWPEKFIEHGSIDELFNKYGLDAEQVAERICEFIERKA